MDIVYIIVVIIVFGFVVNVLLKQTYNFIFILGKKPLLWVVSVAVVGIVTWVISWFLRLNINIPAWVSIMALVMNLPPSQKAMEEGDLVKKLTDDVYKEMGIKNGRSWYKFGLFVFVMSCVASWLIFYGEVCSGDECQSFIERII